MWTTLAKYFATCLLAIVTFLPGCTNGTSGSISLPSSQFALSQLVVSPPAALPGEPITISTDVTNTGVSDNTCSLLLKVEGTTQAIRNVTVKAGQTQTVKFITITYLPGRYSVDVNSQVGQYVIMSPSGAAAGANSYSSAPSARAPPYSFSPPAGATALCSDGTYSYSQNRRGT